MKPQLGIRFIECVSLSRSVEAAALSEFAHTGRLGLNGEKEERVLYYSIPDVVVAVVADGVAASQTENH